MSEERGAMNPAPSAMVPRVGLLDHAASGLGGAQLVLAHLAAALARRVPTEVLHYRPAPLLPLLEHRFGLDLRAVTERRVHRGAGGFAIPGHRGALGQLRQNAVRFTAPYDLFIYSGHGVPPICFAQQGLVYCHFPLEASPGASLEQDVTWQSRGTLNRRVRLAVYRGLWRARMRRYVVVANSAYTARWIARRWQMPAEVVYPPVALRPPVRQKRDTIMSVARFAGGPRSKHQLAQVEAFRALGGAAAGWTLVLAGSCEPEGEDAAYLRAVQQAAAGARVQLLVNVDRAVVVEQLAAAKLFWHTAGLGVREDAEPGLAEHFGIATVEAMRAGCVPVVVASGGQREILEDGLSGFLVKSPDALVTHTRRLLYDPALRAAMSAAARARSEAFGAEVFEERILALAGTDLGAAPRAERVPRPAAAEHRVA